MDNSRDADLSPIHPEHELTGSSSAWEGQTVRTMVDVSAENSSHGIVFTLARHTQRCVTWEFHILKMTDICLKAENFPDEHMPQKHGSDVLCEWYYYLQRLQ